MKKRINIWFLTLIVALSLFSCLKEDNVSDPEVSDVKMFMEDVNGNDSLITEIHKGAQIKIVAYTNADLVSIWPGGNRIVLKKANSTVDSIDAFDHPVLQVSDHFSDYGLVKAEGLTTTLTEGGWYASYTYPNSGDFDLTIVATNHGYDSPDLRRKIYEMGKVTVK